MQQMYSCPNCSAPVAFGARFCTGCGAPLNWPSQPQTQPPPVYQQPPNYRQQPITQRKPTSGWAKFGKALFILGILCLIAAPIIFVASSNDKASSSAVRPFTDLEELKAWLGKQPVIQNPGFPIPKTAADYEANNEKGRVTSRNAFSLQKAAARDGYLISVSPTGIGDGDLWVSLNIAILKNGDVYAFSSDGEEPTYWTNIGLIQ